MQKIRMHVNVDLSGSQRISHARQKQGCTENHNFPCSRSRVRQLPDQPDAQASQEIPQLMAGETCQFRQVISLGAFLEVLSKSAPFRHVSHIGGYLEPDLNFQLRNLKLDNQDVTCCFQAPIYCAETLPK